MSVIAAVVVAVVAVALGGVGVLLLAGANAIDCHINIFYGCSDNGGGGGGGASQTVTVGATCTSAPNSCGMTNLGTIVNNGNGTGSCNAAVPSDSECPAPQISQGGFYANPSTVGVNGQTTLYWSSSNATACTISGDNGFSYAGGGASGSAPTGVLSQTTTFTLTCQDGGKDGPTTSATTRVIISPHYKEI